MGWRNKRFVRDCLIDPITFHIRWFFDFAIDELVFNRLALDVTSEAKAVYLVNCKCEQAIQVLKNMLLGGIVVDGDEETFTVVKYENEEYQGLFSGWQAIMF